MKSRINSIFTSLNKNKQTLSNAKGKLSNLKCAVKDNICTNFLPTTCASKMLLSIVRALYYTPPYNATIVDLVKQEGAFVVGKTNMDEFGMGSENVHSIFGPVPNPKNLDKVAGGSSGGSAAAVGAGYCDFSFGTDTGGSTRLPAAYCGVLGFKPSYGLVSRFGVISYASSLDTVGIISDKINIIKVVFDVVNKFDANDPTSLSLEKRSILSKGDEAIDEDITIGIPYEYFPVEIDENSDILKDFEEIISFLTSCGVHIKPVSLPHVKHALPTYYIIAAAEAASNLSKFDGLKYGYKSGGGSHVEDNRSESFGNEVKRRIALGNMVLSTESYESYFRKAQKVRRLIQKDFDNVFKKTNIISKNGNDCQGTVDFLLTPVTISRPPPIEKPSNNKNTLNEYANDALLVPSSLAGLPSIAVPLKTETSVQLIGQYGDDLRMLKIVEKFLQ